MNNLKIKQKKYLAILSVVILAISLITIFTIAGKKIKIDLTEDKLYTLSKESLTIVNRMAVPINLRLYYSKTGAKKGDEGLRIFNNYYLYVKDLLSEFAAHSHNNLRLSVIDPRPDTEDEEDAVRMGLKKFQLTETESYIFGLVATSNSGVQRVIEFLDPRNQESIEYDIAKLLAGFDKTPRKRLGIVSALDFTSQEIKNEKFKLMTIVRGREVRSWFIGRILKDFYDVKKIEHDAETISNVDLLLVFYPQDLPINLQWAVDQYLLKGGRAFIAIDPFATHDPPKTVPPNSPQPPIISANIPKVLNSLGLEMPEQMCVGDPTLAGMMRVNASSPAKRMLAALICDGRCLDDPNISSQKRDISTANLKNMVFIFPGILNRSGNAPELKYTPLISTTKTGNTYKVLASDMDDPDAIIRKFQEGNGTNSQVIAYKVMGKINSAFPSGADYNKKHLSGLNKSEKEMAAIVVADTDFLYDRFVIRESAMGITLTNDNIAFFLNALESLAGSADLLSIRTKGKVNRPFTVIDKIELEAERRMAKRIAQINNNIQKFQNQLTTSNTGVITNEGLQMQKELNQKIAALKHQLRDVRREGREKVERIGKYLQYFNTLFVPFILTIVGTIITIKRMRVRRRSKR
ncbi:MAG: Gldg family protein [Oligoflexia bacterium]|nr:Gldg family protein [Oligoflexia bacterium]